MKPFPLSLLRSRRTILTLGLCGLLLAPSTMARNAGAQAARAALDNDPLVDSAAGGKGSINYGTGTVRAAGCGRHRLDARTFVEGGRAPPSTHVQGHRSPARHDRGIRPYRDLRSGGRGEPHPVGVHGAGLKVCRT